MRATLRITWLLLSLSFIFHSVCSDDVKNVTTALNDTATITSVPAIVSTLSNDTTAVVASGTVPIVDATTKSGTTQIPVTTKSATALNTQGHTAPSTTAVTPDAIKTTATHKPVTGIQTAPTTQTSGSATTVVKATTPLLATTTGNNNNSVVRPTNTLQTLTASVPSNTSGTETTVRTSANKASVGKTVIPISTDAPTVQQSTAHTITITLNTNQVSQRGTEKTTVTAASHGQATTEPAGNKGTTSTPSTLTKEELPAAQTSGTTASSTMTMQTTSNSSSASTTAATTTTTTTTAQQKTLLYSLNSGQESEEEKEMVQVCKRLMMNLQDGNCSLSWRHQNGKIQFNSAEINGKVKTNVASQYYEEITKKPTDNKTLIAILASCGALLIMIVILALCASHHRKPYNENQQHLTEELHTVENGYHDNPTLEVMEVQSEMQEKKMTLNGEFNDSWIVPMDNVLKEDILDEEDTHL